MMVSWCCWVVFVWGLCWFWLWLVGFCVCCCVGWCCCFCWLCIMVGGCFGGIGCVILFMGWGLCYGFWWLSVNFMVWRMSECVSGCVCRWVVRRLCWWVWLVCCWMLCVRVKVCCVMFVGCFVSSSVCCWWCMFVRMRFVVLILCVRFLGVCVLVWLVLRCLKIVIIWLVLIMIVSGLVSWLLVLLCVCGWLVIWILFFFLFIVCDLWVFLLGFYDE